MKAATREALWSRLREGQFVAGERPVAGGAETPWFVRLMLGFAGWMGALFLVGFVGVAFPFVVNGTGAALGCGALACAFAWVTMRAAPKSDFVSQFGLAVSFTGQVLLVTGAHHGFARVGVGLALFVAWQQALLFWLAPNVVHRLWTACGVALALAYALLDGGLFVPAPAGVTAAFLGLTLGEFRLARYGRFVRPAVGGFALAAVLVTLVGDTSSSFSEGGNLSRLSLGEMGRWLGRAAGFAVWVSFVSLLLRREGVGLGSVRARLGLGGALVLGLAFVQAPGVGLTTAVILAGYANANRAVTGFGVLALLAYLSRYYYGLSATLLEKSVWLLAAGAVMLIGRLVLRWVEPPTPAPVRRDNEEESHA